ncbi:16S rRNA processing protein RimM [Geovibrio thiophilus]|uniref:Ribosome maturation factor RimM n=1 Tax=Geovibrio thiophilus TaxID=139438 RepID=A0A410K1E0_9BACT|nr:ribosome maturation factor RimM [Geovibrio thiophilus]QAR34125.1 16S rRNA processing protein RimM [Geovibrio thiophilus]
MNFIRVGFITGSHGLDGTVKIAPNTDNPQIYADMEYLMTAKSGTVKGSYEITSVHEHGSAILMQLKGVDTKEKAQALKGLEVVIPENVLPEEGEGDIYWHKIDNAEVVDENGIYIGRLTDYLETGSNDVFVITEGGKSWMISNNEHHVLKIDTANRRITVDRAGLVSEDI